MYRILGRDPERQPLTELELALFEESLFRHVESEFSPRADAAALTGVQTPL